MQLDNKFNIIFSPFIFDVVGALQKYFNPFKNGVIFFSVWNIFK